MAQGNGDAQLHFHTLREILELLFPGQVQFFKQRLIHTCVPIPKGVRHDCSHLLRVQAGGDAYLVQHHPDVFFQQADIVPIVLSQQCDGATVPGDHVQNQADSGAFPRSVLPHKTHDAPAGQGQVYMIQREARIAFAQVLDFDCVHSVSSQAHSSISTRSALLRLQLAARLRISEKCPSIFFRFSSRSSSTFFGATKQPLPGTV